MSSFMNLGKFVTKQLRKKTETHSWTSPFSSYSIICIYQMSFSILGMSDVIFCH